MINKLDINWRLVSLYGVVVAALLIPRLFGLDRFVTPDEPTWLYRSANFYNALVHGDLASTYQKEHPGVTTMWAGTAGFLLRDPRYPMQYVVQVDRPEVFARVIEDRQMLIRILAAGRSFVVLGIVASLVLAFFFAVRLLGTLPALFGFLLLAFDPFSIAHARLLHLDGLLSALMLLSLLAFLSFLYRGRQRLDLLVSAVAAGLSWLTKSPAIFLLPFFGLLVLIELVQAWRSMRRVPVRTAWKLIIPLLVWLGIAVMVFVVLWPSMWVNPLGTVSRIISGATDYAIEGHASPIFFNGQIYNGDVTAWYFYPINYLWRTTPLVLIGLLLTGISFVFQKQFKLEKEQRKLIVVLLLFVLLFTVFMTLGGKKFDRYLLPIFAPLDLVAGIGWYTALRALNDTLAEHSPWKSIDRRAIRLGCVVLGGTVIVLQCIAALQTYPYYLTYYNPIMGGSSKASQIMMVGWGEGLDQAARYLNGKPKADKMRVMVWYGGGPFSYFFDGQTNGMDLDTTLADLAEYPYVVLYRNQWERQLPNRELLDYFEKLKPEYVVRLNGIEYARVYNVR